MSIILFTKETIKKLCQSKFSSGVIEKCLDKQCRSIQELIINSILESPNLIKELSEDQNGNYIILKAISIAAEKERNKILYLISTCSLELGNTINGQKIIQKISNLYPQYFEFEKEKIQYNNINMEQQMNGNFHPDIGMKYNYQSLTSNQNGQNVTNNVIINNLFIFNQPSKDLKDNKQKKGFHNTNFNTNKQGFK